MGGGMGGLVRWGVDARMLSSSTICTSFALRVTIAKSHTKTWKASRTRSQVSLQSMA